MERALKIAWIKRIVENRDASWKAIPNYLVSKFGGLDFLVTCDYDLNLLNLESLPEFYRVVLGYWQEFKLLTQSKEKPVKDQIIWNNRNIRLDRKSIFIRDWFNKGITYIKDLLDADLNFLSLASLKEKFQIEFLFTVYYGLLKAIPKDWKTSFRDTAHTGDSASGATTTSILFSTKSAYCTQSCFQDKRYSTPTAEPKILNHGFTKEYIHQVYMLPFRIMNETKLITFQLKIIPGILPTQHSLLQTGLADHDKCPLCNLETQSLTDMLFMCCQPMT